MSENESHKMVVWVPKELLLDFDKIGNRYYPSRTAKILHCMRRFVSEAKIKKFGKEI